MIVLRWGIKGCKAEIVVQVNVGLLNSGVCIEMHKYAVYNRLAGG